MRMLVAAAGIVLAAQLASSPARALELIGQAGILGEWELTANITATGGKQEYAGPIVLAHVGLCSQDGPETKAGEIRLRMNGGSRLKASLLIDGNPCTYSATKSDAYVGTMSCRDRRDVPLRLWVK